MVNQVREPSQDQEFTPQMSTQQYQQLLSYIQAQMAWNSLPI